MPQVTLDLDLLGTNPDNLISDEPHNLSNRPTRAIVPRKGAFFANSVIVYDGATQLHRGVDYQITELHQEATLRTGKEIAEVILIINTAVGSNPTVSYQALGSHYQNSSSAIGNLYETVIQDNRPVDWTNVFNKPTEFNPTIHRHLLDDVYGFEPVVDYLERIVRAVTLGQADVLLTLLQSLLASYKCGELNRVLPLPKFMTHDALFHILTRRKLISNTWVDTQDCTWHKGDSAVFQIDTSEIPVGDPVYWELYQPNGPVALFTRKSGVVLSTGGTVSVQIYVPSEDFVNNEFLYVGVKTDPNATEFSAVTYRIKVQEHKTTNNAYGWLLNFNVLPNDEELTIGAISEDNERRIHYAMSNP